MVLDLEFIETPLEDLEVWEDGVQRFKGFRGSKFQGCKDRNLADVESPAGGDLTLKTLEL
jgi:hypothetical protein